MLCSTALRPALVVLVVFAAGCAGTDLVRLDGGAVGFETDAVPAAVRAEVFALADELGHPARERGGAVEVELAGAPMSERPSRWLRVTVEAGGPRSRVTVTPSPNVAPRGRGGVFVPGGGVSRTDPGGWRRTDALNPAFTFAEALADRL